MTKTAFFILLVVSWFGLNFARAATTTVEPNENNIEQLLAEKEAGKAETKTGTASRSDAATTAGELAVEAPGAASVQSQSGISASAKESEIPVQLEVKKAAAAEGSPFSKMILGMLLVVGLAGGAWVAIRRHKHSNKGLSAATQMKILAQHHLGPKRSLAVVRVAGESILIGITDHHISMIKSLSLLDEELPEEAPQNFERVLGRKQQNDARRETQAEEGEDFALGGIKDFVSTKLKNMRSFE